MLKFTNFILLALILSSTLQLNAQDYSQNVHQYIVREAWEYLKARQSWIQYSPMAWHIGTTEQGDPADPWAEGLVAIGAWREDEEDPVFEVNDPTPSSSHFWDADAGDEWEFCIQPCPPYCDCLPNAYKKAYIYTYGNWQNNRHRIFFRKTSWLQGWGTILGRYYTYNSLFELYNTGRVYYYGFVDVNWTPHILYDPPIEVYIPLETAQKWAYLILGRIAHLLSDMGVPAHSHGDQHDPFWGGSDEYEEWMQTNYNRWDHSLAPIGDQGTFGPIGLINLSQRYNPLRFLFYVANQVSDRISSDDYDGDYNYISNYNGDNYGEYLNPIYSYFNEINYPIYHPPGVGEGLVPIGNTTFCFNIKAVASLLYWFAQQTNQSACVPPTINSVSSSLGSLIYRGENTNLTANISGTGPFNYQWFIYKCGQENSLNNCCGWDFTGWPFSNYFSYSGWTSSLFNFGVNINYNNLIYCSYNSDPECQFYPPLVCGGIASNPIWFKVKLVVTNCEGHYSATRDYFYGIHPRAIYRPVPPPCPGGGCPYLLIQTSDSLLSENNILHRSEFPEFSGTDIRDLYCLKSPPPLIDNQYTLTIKEFENDYNYFDMVKFYAVDHPADTKIGVTENNDIVIYDTASISSSNYAVLNNLQNVTTLIRYDTSGKTTLTGETTDSISAQNFQGNYNNCSDSLAIIGEIGEGDEEPCQHLWGGGNQKYWAGEINIYYNSLPIALTKRFARREISSNVIIPILPCGAFVDSAIINWFRDYTLGYMGIVPIRYTGFNVTEIPLIDAENVIQGDVLSNLMSIDSNYAELDSNSLIVLKFNGIGDPPPNMVRDFVFEVNGRYTVGGGSTRLILQNQNPANTPRFSYKLYVNYPNPFNAKTKIKYDIGAKGKITIAIYNILGQLVSELVNEYKEPGSYSVDFDGTNLASGVYFYRLESANFVETKKLLLVK